MPAPIIIEDLSGIGRGIRNAGSALEEVLTRSAQKKEEEKKRLKQQTGLQAFVEGLGENPTQEQFTSAIIEAMKRGVPVEQLKIIGDVYQPRFKEQARSAGEMDYLRQQGLIPTGESGARSGGTLDATLQATQLDTPATPETANIGMQETVTPEGMQQTRGGADISAELRNLSESQLAAMQGSGYPKAKSLATYELERRKQEQSNMRSDRDFAYKQAKPFMDQIEKDRRRVADQKESVYLMESALKNGDLSFFSKDNLATILGKYGEGLRSSEGAVFNTALKEFLLADIGRLRGQPNQWIEQQVSGALAKIGRSQAANDAVVRALKSRVARDEMRIKLTDDLNAKYKENLGFEPGNISAIVAKELEPYEKQAQKQLSYDLRRIEEQDNPPNPSTFYKQKVPQGTPMTLEMGALFLDKYKDPEKARENAKKLGYTIFEAEDYRRFSR